MSFPRNSSSGRRSMGFTLMEIVVVIAIILVLAAIALPVYSTVQQRSVKGAATSMMRQLAAGAQTYMSQNDGELPKEDAKGTNSWQAAADPVNANAWYNAIPRLLGNRTVGEYASRPRDFYTKENLLFLQGASYPESDKKLVSPLFAVAINSRIQRKDEQGDKHVKMSQIVNPNKTVLFLEQGLPNEKKTVATQPKYTGDPKGNALTFVGRYGGFGHLAFVDGHVDLVNAEDLLDSGGRMPFPPEGIIWARSPEDNPN